MEDCGGCVLRGSLPACSSVFEFVPFVLPVSVVYVHSAFGPNVKEPLLSLSQSDDIPPPLVVVCECVFERGESLRSLIELFGFHSFPHDVRLSTLSLYNDCPFLPVGRC